LDSFNKSNVQNGNLSNGTPTKFDNSKDISKENPHTKFVYSHTTGSTDDVQQSKHIKFDDIQLKSDIKQPNKHFKFDDVDDDDRLKTKVLKPNKHVKFDKESNSDVKNVINDTENDNISKKPKRVKPEKHSNLPENGEAPLTVKRRKLDEQKSLLVNNDSPAANVAECVPSVFNDKYASKKFRKQLKNTWLGKSNKPMFVEDGHVLTSPFNACHLPAFLTSPSLLKGIVTQLKGIEMLEKSNDMYKFHQSRELPTSGACGELRTLLTSRVRPWLAQATGIPLNDTLDLSASLYGPSDTLLCHDDELEGRRIAFILYLSEWEPSNGGSLDLFSVDDRGNPDRVVQRLYPQHNTFAFFEVSPVSYHQVSEVFSGARLSVAGWFHGPPIQRPPKPLPSPRCFQAPGDVPQETLFSWVNPLYLAEATQASVRRQFQEDSEIVLEAFLDQGKFDALAEEVQASPKMAWLWAGPPNRAHYQHLGTLSAQAKEFLQVMRSEAMFLVISQLTGLCLHPLYTDEEEKEGRKDEFVSSDSDGEDEDSEGEEEEEGGSSPEKLITLKSLLKKVKTDQVSGCDFSKKSNLKSAWCEDTGDVNANNKSGNTGTDDSKTGSNDSKTSKKKSKNKKEKVSTAVTETSSSVYASVRRMTHGCYSLVLDDNNTAETDVNAAKIADNAAEKADTAVKSSKKPKDKVDIVSRETSGQSSDKNGNGVNDDSDDEAAEGFAMDACLYMNVPDDWEEGFGGNTVYIAKDDDKELLSVAPRNNSLSLVYRDAATFPFLKHLNCKAERRGFHSVALQYRGK